MAPCEALVGFESFSMILTSPTKCLITDKDETQRTRGSERQRGEFQTEYMMRTKASMNTWRETNI
jgi:hypothetical protein